VKYLKKKKRKASIITYFRRWKRIGDFKKSRITANKFYQFRYWNNLFWS